MYESPINVIVQDIEEQMAQQTEQTILEVVRKCGVVVDKDELVEALTYDRGQYSKGYKDGVNDTLDKIRAEIEFEVDHRTNMLCAEDVFEIFDKYNAEVEKLQPVTPKQKMGRWITQWNVAHQKEYYYCSECREEFSYDGETGIKMNDYNFCPNCGAKMEESE